MGSSILDRRLILVAGKGGVGRSTLAAAIARATAARGRRTLLFEANAKDRFGAMFGRGPVGTEIVSLAPNLSAVNTTPSAALEEYGLMILRFRRIYKMVFENRITRAFLRAIPGLDDYSVIGKAWYHTTETDRGKPVWDTLVFDMPASGHALSMLRLPRAILDTVPEGPLTRDARSLQELLADPARTALILVTLAEEMPAVEARELAEVLDRDVGVRVAHMFVNQVYPDRFPAGTPMAKILDAVASRSRSGAAAPGGGDDAGTAAADASDPGAGLDPDLAAAIGHAELARDRRRLNETYLARLRQTIAAPQTQLPVLFSPVIGPSELRTLSDMVAAELTRAG